MPKQPSRAEARSVACPACRAPAGTQCHRWSAIEGRFSGLHDRVSVHEQRGQAYRAEQQRRSHEGQERTKKRRMPSFVPDYEILISRGDPVTMTLDELPAFIAGLAPAVVYRIERMPDLHGVVYVRVTA